MGNLLPTLRLLPPFFLAAHGKVAIADFGRAVCSNPSQAFRNHEKDVFVMKNAFLLLLAVLGLSACASAEFTAARNLCAPEAWRIYPSEIRQMVENRIRYEMRGTGRVRCTAYGSYEYRTTNCVEDQESVAIPYQVLVNVDVNANSREVFLERCAMERCISRYGREKCKAGI